jgi:hypothetical protein
MKAVKKFPPPGLEILGASGKKIKPKKGSKKMEPARPDEYEWRCPVKDCWLGHHSVKGEGGKWEQKENEGALMVYIDTPRRLFVIMIEQGLLVMRMRSHVIFADWPDLNPFYSFN